ncbi:MAG: glucose 1-dehydrogenase [Caulobacter sp.]|nr:glucose 1-dehydrogenase [Caulobacter sp.]
MTLKNKVAIVTGGGRDIGREVSLKLAAEGARVCINFANDEASARETLSQITAAGGTAILHRADVTKSDQVDGLVAACRAAFGDSINILVNLAGGMVARRPLADMDEAFFDQVMNLNLKSAFLMTRAVVPLMSAGGAIINFSSLAGRDGGGPGAAVYATSKGAVSTFTRSMAKELGPRGIRVNALCPGMISTSFHDTFSKDEVRKSVAGSTALRREGRASEVADVTAFLASDGAAYVTGVNLDVNGGLAFS